MVDRRTINRWLGVDYAAGAEKLSPPAFVLRDTLASKKQGRPIYFQMPTRIGPCNTSNPRDAERFDTEADAKACPAYSHPLCNYVVEPAPEVRHG